MARIPYFDMADAPAAYTELLKERRPLNLYRMLPHAGPAASAGFLGLGGALLRHNVLDARLREIAILRVGLLSQASYEVHQHTRLALSIGLSQAKIDALQPGADTAALDDLERQVLGFTDQVVHHVKAPDAMFDALAERLSHREMSELLLTIGFYMLVSRFLENLEIDIEEPGVV